MQKNDDVAWLLQTVKMLQRQLKSSQMNSQASHCEEYSDPGNGSDEAIVDWIISYPQVYICKINRTIITRAREICLMYIYARGCGHIYISDKCRVYHRDT